MSNEKEFLYVGYYIDTEGRTILKVGTTDNLERRAKEHNRYYSTKAKKCRMCEGGCFEYLWHCPLSKYNTLRYEDRTRAKWKKQNIGQFINNDRFILDNPPDFVEITIRKTYQIKLVF